MRVPRIVLPLVSALGLLGVAPSVARAAAPPDPGHCHLPAWVPAPTAPFDAHGTAVVLDGALAAVSAPGGGAVTTYARVAGQWLEGDRLAAPPTSGGAFGASLALEGGRLVVGDPSDSTHGVDAGAVHVYLHDGAGWAWAQTLWDPAGAPGDRLGASVSVTTDWIAAGAPGDDGTGRAHVFRDQPGGWTWWIGIHQFGTGAFPEAFGAAVAMEGDWLLVGDPLDDAAGVDSGGAYLYRVLEPFAFYEDMLVPPEVQAGDGFGGALAFVGDRIVIGAPGDDGQGADAGAAYVVAFDASAGDELSVVQRIVSDGGGAGDRFGSGVAVHGERVVAGAPGKETPATPGGRAVVFHRDAGVVPEHWTVEVEAWPGDGVAGDAFGAAVAVSGWEVLVGAPDADPAGASSGAAYLVSLASTTQPGGPCPCDVVASARSFGVGKPGAAGVPGLAFDHPPVVGEPVTLELRDALPGAVPFLFWGATAAAVPFDGGTLHVAPFQVQALPTVDGTGTVDAAYLLPADPTLCGLVLVFQAMFVDPAASGTYQTAQTAGLEVVVGS